VSKTPAFWDASALVPLCIGERTTPQALLYLRRFTPVVWWASLVEVRSAICRLHRDHHITDRDKQGGFSRLRLLSLGWREVLPHDHVRDLAAESLEKYSLRAADAMQLAAALIWCQQRPARRSFFCGDRQLAEAAGTAGFAVLSLL
jgi:predicted nucleic acid-binding protein